jgi:hypothetical protein
MKTLLLTQAQKIAFSNNKTVNPLTGRKIKKGGPTYAALMRSIVGAQRNMHAQRNNMPAQRVPKKRVAKQDQQFAVFFYASITRNRIVSPKKIVEWYKKQLKKFERILKVRVVKVQHIKQNIFAIVWSQKDESEYVIKGKMMMDNDDDMNYEIAPDSYVIGRFIKIVKK